MTCPVDLILITWNRRHYVEKTVANLLASPDEFRLRCWDNASEDGTADLLRSIDDPRVVEKHFHPENVRQREPWLWFLERAEGPLVGKLDDDILVPHGWVDRLAGPLLAEPRFGGLACWPFMESDWDEANVSRRSIRVGGATVLRMVAVQGHSMLLRRETARRFIQPPGGYGLPIDWFGMSRAGLINGFLVPPLFGHNMDDPRSPHYAREDGGAIGPRSALTARSLGFRSDDDYAAWIHRDAWCRQRYSYRRQYWWRRLGTNRPGRLLRRALKFLEPSYKGP